MSALDLFDRDVDGEWTEHAFKVALAEDEATKKVAEFEAQRRRMKTRD
jgi:hypothetical protein